MKAKLLKKIRKRFDYKFQKNGICWYDLAYNCNYAIFEIKYFAYYSAEKVIGFKKFNKLFGHKKHKDCLKKKN